MPTLNDGRPYRISGHFKDFDIEAAFPHANEGDELMLENDTGVETFRFSGGTWHGIHHEPREKIPLWFGSKKGG